tara:strand:- start:882 stop:1007 length:126 start_codon:yes stop_codon:yes gene_type:complete
MRDSKVKVNWVGVLVWLILIPLGGVFFFTLLWKFIGWVIHG